MSKVILHKEQVEIMVCKSQLINLLESITYDTPYPEVLNAESEDQVTITRNIRITATANNGSVLIISNSMTQEPNYNFQLINAIAKSHYRNNLLISNKAKSSIDIQKMENLNSKTYVVNILNLRFLAPDIIEIILKGIQPKDLTVQKLFSINTLDRNEQRKLLNF